MTMRITSMRTINTTSITPETVLSFVGKRVPHSCS
jgi:hypothetical protein